MIRNTGRRGDGFVLLPATMIAAVITAFALTLVLHPSARAAEGAGRVLALGGAVTEIVYALGEEERLIGRDSTSTFPEAATSLPDVGYVRALSPEGVLSVGPDLILAEEGAGPPEAIDVLRAAEVDFVTVPGGFGADAVLAKIRTVGGALGVPAKTEALADETRAALAEAAARAEAHDGAPMRVLFVMSAEGGRLMAAGQGTAADGIIRLAGAENAMRGFQGYKQVSDEAVAAAAPDVVLMMDRSGEHAVSDETLFASPALRTTPAARSGTVLRMDGLKLLGFGPRTAQAVEELSTALYGG
ncbi:heme/hemin ABC transporter substrate-binding protein [Roseivivax halodurans]|uniref:heme/hemin ABC transporter substrate-binding protein n=1 Tax=Roseivivax halodurans TaxID=93683 RepID=UPI003CC7592F